MAGKLVLTFIAGIEGGHQINLSPVSIPFSQSTIDAIKADMALVGGKPDATGEELDFGGTYKIPIPINILFVHTNVNVEIQGELELKAEDDPNAPKGLPAVVVVSSKPVTLEVPPIAAPEEPAPITDEPDLPPDLRTEQPGTEA